MQVFFFSFCAMFRSRQIARFYYFLTSFPYNTFFILQNQPEKGLFPSGGFHRARAGRWRGKFAII